MKTTRLRRCESATQRQELTLTLGKLRTPNHSGVSDALFQWLRAWLTRPWVMKMTRTYKDHGSFTQPILLQCLARAKCTAEPKQVPSIMQPTGYMGTEMPFQTHAGMSNYKLKLFEGNFYKSFRTKEDLELRRDIG